MRHQSPSPTHQWLLTNKIMRWLAGAFLVFLFFTVLIVSAITYSIRRDCSNPYRRTLEVGGYWLVIHMGSTEAGCAES